MGYRRQAEHPRNVSRVAERTTLEAYGFTVVKTPANPRHFTLALPGATNATIDLLRSLMERWCR
ncbi:MAG: hypothetical protein NTU77_03080 [Actinobacteria bacterium]|nr:hypothetical protein [Actinomycetota bacterium]